MVEGERIPILKMGDLLLVTIQVDMHDRLAMRLQDDLTERIVSDRARGVLIDISSLEVVDSFIGRMLADTAGGFAAFLASPVGSRVVTIEMKINFLEAVEHGDLKADARVLRQGRTTSVVDCDVTDSDGRLVSKALMTFSVK